MDYIMLRITLLLISTTLLSLQAQSSTINHSYFDESQGLLFGLGQLTSDDSWRQATEQEIAILFAVEYFGDPGNGNFQQTTVNAILALGGSGSYTPAGLSCQPLGGMSCQNLQAICVINSVFPGCDSLQVVSHEGFLTLDGWRVSDQEYWITYSGIDGNWTTELLGPAAMLSDYCGGIGNTPCNLPEMLVSEVPLPSAAWLFVSALVAITGL